jgi:hypothetical protein
MHDALVKEKLGKGYRDPSPRRHAPGGDPR